MKLNRTQIIAASVAGAVVFVAGGAGIHAASVHEQGCLSYERQITSEMSTMQGTLSKATQMFEDVQQNPFSAFAYMGELVSLRDSALASQKALNDTKYAYVGTCGKDRFDRFVETPAVKGKVTAISEMGSKLAGN